jgi:hypothetical protein
VIGRAQLGGRIERIDQDEALGRLERQRRDVLFPLVMPRRPAAEPWRKLVDVETLLDQLRCARTPIHTATARARAVRVVRM